MPLLLHAQVVESALSLKLIEKGVPKEALAALVLFQVGGRGMGQGRRGEGGVMMRLSLWARALRGAGVRGDGARVPRT